MGKFAAEKPNETMQKCKISFFDVEAYAQKAIDAINAGGPTALALANDGFRVYSAVTGHNWPELFAAFNDAQADGAKVVAVIRSTFGI